MTITLNHTIVPARDQKAAAKFFARLFGLKVGKDDYFAKVKVNDGLTLLFSDETDDFESHHYAFHVTDAEFESHHYAFHVSDVEFDAILARVKKAGLAFGSGPGSHTNGKLNRWNGGRGFYFKVPDGHLLELMTEPQ
jgi:catechol 2,3-dioxygenase-like lactoylglutathione lyase family enzyme